MQVIYIRVSTEKQDAKNQLADLRNQYPNAAVVEETASGVRRRPELKALVGRLQAGDELIVAALDRLGRHTAEIITLIEDLGRRGIALKSMREGLDYSTPAGKLMTQLMCSFAELERNLISERTKMALDAKRKQGIIGGRRPKFGVEIRKQVFELREFGHTQAVIAKRLGMSVGRVSQILREVR